MNYSLILMHDVVLGTPENFYLEGKPDCEFKGNTLITNAPCLAFVNLSLIKIANINVIVGGVVDSFEYSPRADPITLDFPVMTPATRVRFAAHYTGFVPPGMKAGDKFTFQVHVKGEEIPFEVAAFSFAKGGL